MNSLLIILVISSVAVLESQSQSPPAPCPGFGTYCNSVNFCQNPTENRCQNKDELPFANYTCRTGQYCQVDGTGSLKGSCKTDVTNSCNGINTYKCSAVGTFPNPSDCTSYYVCSENEAGDGLDVEAKTCFTGYVFSPLVSGYCALRFGNLNCFTLTCPTTGGTQYIKYGNTLRYYGICEPNKTPVIESCPRGSIFKRSGDKNCEYVCPGFGNFPNSEDEQKYFTCIFAPGVGYRATENKCGVKEIYNVSTRSCQRRRL